MSQGTGTKMRLSPLNLSLTGQLGIRYPSRRPISSFEIGQKILKVPLRKDQARRRSAVGMLLNREGFNDSLRNSNLECRREHFFYLKSILVIFSFCNMYMCKVSFGVRCKMAVSKDIQAVKFLL
ncbi:hypothetical protein CEXT_463981 [Caerostris extrusa]|uniref:Uncharacterized protein n=1 Tax=Caerostris extrusa TaxID=172846 RepID=A0AAV4M4F4_CAEEX|nr:hypothetical protein CEXT_463981 [Caerostris extrusa]